MLGFSSTPAVDFLPDEDARAWVADGLTRVSVHLGTAAQVPRVVTDTSIPKPRDFDDLFELICGVQSEIGQQDVEFSLVELQSGAPPVPKGFAPLGNPDGQLLHTFHKGGEYVMVTVPAIFRLTPVVLSSVARELGRIAIHEADRTGTALREGEPKDAQDMMDREGDAELAGIALGLGVWVANGAYVYENACCGGGCGIDLTSLRAALSMPEACFALAVDGQRKGLSRRVLARHLDANQKAALKRSWGFVKKQPALTAAPTTAALGSA